MQHKIPHNASLCLSLSVLLAIGASAYGLEMAVKPYLNAPTADGMVVRWETDVPATSSVRWGSGLPLAEITTSAGMNTLHEVQLTGLKPGMPYFYQVFSRDESAQEVASEVYTFGTAALPGTGFGFVVLCDTQSNPETLRRLAEFAYAQRPSFTLIGGDLVSDGNAKDHWTGHFFPNMEPLNTRVPLVPILGNHENNARHYYDYFTLPDPEYRYVFEYGNLTVFLLDSQKSFKESSDDYRWLEDQLRRSKTTWKIVMLHKPAYSSDQDDYGDTLTTYSIFGDMNARRLVPLYEKYGVDIVWSGHIHSYERTWPLKGDKAVSPKKGVVYLITGGGGGGLEKAAPVRTHLSAKVYSGHHYCHVMINGGTLRMEAYDGENRLFDWMELQQ